MLEYEYNATQRTKCEFGDLETGISYDNHHCALEHHT